MSDEPEAYRPRRAWREEQSSAAESATPSATQTDADRSEPLSDRTER